MLKILLELWSSHADAIVTGLVAIITRAIEKAALKKKYTKEKVNGTD